ncbi:MAG: low molecular weight protein-tyrosine-phosphatase [Aquaticitalea sp.]
MITRILMVCLGNICRSPLAHGILQSKLPADKYQIDSAGTGNYHIGSPPDARSIKVANQYGIDISNQTCRQFQRSDFDLYDLIYVMDESNFSNVVKLARDAHDIAKVKLILDSDQTISKEVPDPYHGNPTDFENVFHLLNDACDTIALRLQNRN